MALSRREFLSSTAAVLGSSILPSLAPAAEQRPFLYSLDDVLNLQNDLSQFQKFYLDTIPLAVINVWAVYCYPCLAEMPEKNRLYQRYGARIPFISALAENVIQQKTPDLRRYVTDFLDYRYHGQHVGRRNQLKEDFDNGPPYDPILQSIIEKSKRSVQERQQTVSPPTYRKELGETITILKVEKSWPLFPTYILDDAFTSEYIRYEVLPHTVLLSNGKVQVISRGKLEKELRKVL